MLDLSTIYVYSTAINIAMAVVATLAYLRNGGQTEVMFWCAAAWLIVIGSLLINSPNLLAPELVQYVGGLTYVTAMGMMRLGFLSFFGRPYRLSEAVSVALVTCLGLAVLDVGSDANAQVAIIYAGAGINLAMTAKVLWQGKSGERLPSRSYAGATFMIYALCNFLTALAAALAPVTISGGVPVSSWIGPTSIVLVILNLASFLLAVVVVLERSGETQRQLAERDGLTGVLNRRMFMTRAEVLAGQAGALAMIDLDNFKRINDTHGHIGGDEALVQFAALVGQRLPPGALFGRLGGEEFGICLPGHDMAMAEDLLECLRRDLEATRIRAGDRSFTLTMSCGFVIMNDRERDLDSWLVDADCALYAAKNGGRNRVVAFDPVGSLRSHAVLAEVASMDLRFLNDSLPRSA